jgi:NAD(P)-dependent dehydrogenase (short-subunit alcohol dehydrogenase family)
VLVNNAGILRDRMLFNMSEAEWDAIMKVHLKGHFATTRHAAAYWRDQSKAGKEAKRSVVNTSSTSGLFGNLGQTNYGAAKTGIATFSIIADAELARYGVRVNAIAPAAATRLTGLGRPPREEPPPGEWSPMDPANVSPFVAYLATEDCPIHGRVFFVQGGGIFLFEPFTIVDRIEKEGRWTVEELRVQAPKFQEVKFDYGHPLGNQMIGNRLGQGAS